MPKRGRPNVYQKYSDERILEQTKNSMPGKTDRTYANKLYLYEGMHDIWEIRKQGIEIPYLKEIFDDTDYLNNPNVVCKDSIIMQLGRMSLQDNYDLESIKNVLTIVAQAYHNGATVRDCENYIRKVRKTGLL